MEWLVICKGKRVAISDEEVIKPRTSQQSTKGAINGNLVH
jgi:hypothetical protein